MLGSSAEADDAVQESWLRLSRSDPSGIDTWRVGSQRSCRVSRSTCCARVGIPVAKHPPMPTCPNRPHVTQARATQSTRQRWPTRSGPRCCRARNTGSCGTTRVCTARHVRRALRRDRRNLGALAQRCEQLASRARRRVRGSALNPDADQARQREVVEHFFAARGPAISMRSWLCSIPTSRCTRTWQESRWARPASSLARPLCRELLRSCRGCTTRVDRWRTGLRLGPRWCAEGGVGDHHREQHDHRHLHDRGTRDAYRARSRAARHLTRRPPSLQLLRLPLTPRGVLRLSPVRGSARLLR